MIQLALLVVTVCVAAMVFARWLPGGRLIALAAANVLIYLVGMVAWWSALYSQAVPLGRLLAQLDMHGPNHPAFTAGFFWPAGYAGGRVSGVSTPPQASSGDAQLTRRSAA